MIFATEFLCVQLFSELNNLCPTYFCVATPYRKAKIFAVMKLLFYWKNNGENNGNCHKIGVIAFSMICFAFVLTFVLVSIGSGLALTFSWYRFHDSLHASVDFCPSMWISSHITPRQVQDVKKIVLTTSNSHTSLAD